MPTGKANSRVIIGGIITVVGVLLGLLALTSAGMMLWQIYNGDSPDFVMIGDWSMSAWEFVGLCAGVLMCGLVLISIGVQYFFRTDERE